MKLFTSLLIACLFIAPAYTPSYSQEMKDFTGNKTIYYGVKINEILCGYADLKMEEENGMIKMDQEIFIMLTALGANINTKLKMECIVDKKTEQFTHFQTNIEQGDTKIEMKVVVKNDTAYFSSPINGEKKVFLPPGTLLENTYFNPLLKRDMIDKKKKEVTYKVFDVQQGELVDMKYKKLGREKMTLAGKEYDALKIEQVNQKSGLKFTMWIDVENGNNLRIIIMETRDIFLADKSVIKKIKVADLNENIVAKTNKAIADLQNITYMKVKASIKPVGFNSDAASLNFPGQKFEGKADTQMIEGIFEVQIPRYDGKNAPPFPTNFKDEKLAEYLNPSDRIESDDPVLVAKAKELTKGSKDSWEAMKRLSLWVSDSIDYVIPGGYSARNTYDVKKGECGAHSMLLAAFCRAVGIPAKVIWGCMYMPNYGGAFGQHGWNEVYMGDAGWVQVDATAREIDYADSGHLKLGELATTAISFNPKKMEILDYKVGSGEMDSKDEQIKKTYADHLGTYVNFDNGRTMNMIAQEGHLTLDIPGKIKLALKEPDNRGRFYAKLSNQLYITFGKKDSKIKSFEIHELSTFKKTVWPEKIDESVPQELRDLLGGYYFAQVRATFTVKYLDGGLAVDDPLAKKTIKLGKPDKEGWRLDEFNKNSCLFNTDNSGKIQSLTFDSKAAFNKAKSAVAEVEEVIEKEGVQAAMARLDGIHKKSGDYFITEKSINLLGYKYLGREKYDEAKAIFENNAKHYPKSFNVYDSLGEAYMKLGKMDLAINNYEKSLELNPKNDNAKKMIDKIKNK